MYEKIRQWVQPYWRPVPPELKEKVAKKEADKKEREQKKNNKETSNWAFLKNLFNKLDKSKSNEKAEDTLADDTQEATTTNQPFTPSALKIETIKLPPHKLISVTDPKYRPKENHIWFYHDETYHEIFAHLLPGTGYKYKDRDDEARKLLEPMLKPLNLEQAYHRTHLLPFGYIGTENDPRLVVGWNGEQNSNGLNEFEQRNKKRAESIYWLTIIKKTDYGAEWKYIILSVETGQLLDSITFKMGTNTKPVKFYWR